jgi:hypothetical protein
VLLNKVKLLFFSRSFGHEENNEKKSQGNRRNPVQYVDECCGQIKSFPGSIWADGLDLLRCDEGFL